jgi:hypothetical protein
MNNTKHTPGPLHNVTGYKPGPWIRQVLNDGSEAYIHDKQCNAIARVYSLSDASLIAAAPAMYQAGQLSLDVMKRVATALERMGNVGLRSIVRSAIIEQEAALAQAEGHQ